MLICFFVRETDQFPLLSNCGHPLSRKKKRKRKEERNRFICNEMCKLKLTSVVKGFVKCWAKMKDDEIGLILRNRLGLQKEKLEFIDLKF
jgi:hypothetical protein